MLKVRIGAAEDGSFGVWSERDGGGTFAQPGDYVCLLNYLIGLQDNHGELALETVSPGPKYQPLNAKEIAEIKSEL
ncbi:MAG: hypothetical protein V1648_00455 [Candidatus Aenigmatarchaeota archaeon]